MSSILRNFIRLRPESDHLLHLDCLRTVAAAGIVVSHFHDYMAGSIGAPLSHVAEAMTLFVDLFFTISGFVIAYVYAGRVRDTRSYIAFMQKRLARLGPLHWATLLAFSVLGILVAVLHIHVNHPHTYDWSCWLPNVFFLQAEGFCNHLTFNGPSWSISAEFGMYAMAPLFFVVGRRMPGALLLLSVLALVGLSVLAGGPHWLRWMAPLGVLRAIPSFLLGAFVFFVRGKINIPAAPVVMWGLMVSFLLGCFLNWPWLLLLCVLYIAFVCAVAADVHYDATRWERSIAAGAQLTYSSYMIHRLIGIFLISVVGQRIMHLSGWPLNLEVFAVFLSVWPLSYLSLVLFERPMRQRLSHKPAPSACRVLEDC